MFIGVKELEQHKLTFREEFAPGTIDFRTREFRQAAALRVELSAELEGREIHIVGRLSTRLELTCARCLEPVTKELNPRFDLLYRPVASIRVGEGQEIELAREDTEIGFYTGDGLFLADVVAEQVHLALPMKVLCGEECQGLCPGCGANLNRERCRCGPRPVDPRLAPLARWLTRSEGEKNQPS
jgi:uncharacterized protein